MKNLTISLSLILMLAGSQTALAETSNSYLNSQSNIETITVIATPAVGNFEIYSEKLSTHAIQKVMAMVISNLNAGSAISFSTTTDI